MLHSKLLSCISCKLLPKGKKKDLKSAIPCFTLHLFNKKFIRALHQETLTCPHWKLPIIMPLALKGTKWRCEKQYPTLLKLTLRKKGTKIVQIVPFFWVHSCAVSLSDHTQCACMQFRCPWVPLITLSYDQKWLYKLSLITVYECKCWHIIIMGPFWVPLKGTNWKNQSLMSQLNVYPWGKRTKSPRDIAVDTDKTCNKWSPNDIKA